MSEIRKQYAEKYLQGKGVEFGALHNPLYTPENSQVLYVDRFTKKELLGRFPELKDHAASIVSTDITLDLDRSDFSTLIKHDFQFYIANHVIEHLINPIRFLKRIHDVMGKKAILYLSVPDKNFTFDKNRQLTSFEHLWHESKKDTIKLSTEHLNDFILNITKDHVEPGRKKRMYFADDKLPLNWLRKRKIHTLHRKRSIHVHVWDRSSFDLFLKNTIEKLNLQFTVIDSNISDIGQQDEMIYIIQKN